MTLAQNSKQECILIVDDSTDNLYLMQFILETQGYKVGLANSGEQALEQVKKDHPDLILLDVMMPQMNGYEVIKRLRKDKSLSSIPVFLVTADKYISNNKAIAVGANGLIYKPIDIEQLLLTVAQTLKSETDFAEG
ncbi:MAG TPA: response regulator [Coleofasciculaceae cyanobacterium]|jgi:two-component system sensor histidine kinase/response regulator